MELIPEQVDACLNLVIERQSIYIKKENGEEPPWTEDAILATYRFPNMFREQDRVTRWIARNWREPNKDSDDVWFALTVARFCNWPPALQDMGYPVPWDPKRYEVAIETRRSMGLKAFTGAYILPTSAYRDKSEYIANDILTPLWENRSYVQPRKLDHLMDFYNRLCEQSGIGKFMAGQIIADCKYLPVLSRAPDWLGWAAPGPGSCRGLNRIVGRDVSCSWNPFEWIDLIDQLRIISTERFKDLPGFPVPHAQDAQGFCCEFDKYERTRLGEGRPRSLYKPATGEEVF